MAKIRLNRQQREAAEDLGHNMVVAAGAGCGKTATLVERYVNILKGGEAEVGDIVAITFTEKAANELKGRIYERLRRLLDAAGDLVERKRWRRHLWAIESARIGTTHSFCTEILREFPFQAGVEAGFSVLEDEEAQEPAGRAVREAVFEAVSERSAAALGLCERFDLSALGGLLEASVSKREEISRVVEEFGVSSSDRAGYAAAVERRVRAAAEEIAGERLSCQPFEEAVSILEKTPGPEGDKLEGRRVAFLSAHAAWREGKAAGPGEAACLMFDAIGRLGVGSKKKWGDGFGPAADALKCLKGILTDCAKMMRAIDEEDWGARAAEVFDFLLLHERVVAKYAEAKRVRGGLDFDDLLTAARGLLRENAAVAEGLGRRYKHVLVDEFQDTDHVQAEIVERIAGGGAKLFVVGDAEQSIYAFRGAEVEVFSRVRENYAETGEGVPKTLTGNYRTLDHALGFINVLFGRLMPAGEGRGGYRTSHMPLETMRDAGREAAGGERRVEVLLGRSAENMYRARNIEAGEIARRIGEICSTGTPAVFEQGDDGREVARTAGYGDIAILFRSMGSVEIYERHLRDAGIPYYTVAGSTFYMRQEVKDLVNLLRFLVDEDDLLSLVGALRGPLFAVSDDLLAELALEGGLLRWFDGRDAPAGEGGDFAAFARAAGLVKRLRALADRVPARRIVDMIFDETGYLAALSMLYSGRQKVLNARKVRDAAAAFDMRGGGALGEFVARVSLSERGEARESEALLEEGESEVVRLMTVHAAKGLEFPIVIVADMGRQSRRSGGGRNRRRGELVVDRRLGILASGGEEAGGYKKVMREVARSRDEAEELRVFFVAASRARDHLILSGAEAKKLKLKGWMRRTVEALEIDIESSGDYPFDRFTVEYRATSEAVRTSARRRGGGLVALRERLIAGDELVVEVTPEDEKILERAGEVSSGFEVLSVFSATQIADFSRCPLRFELLHLRGLPGDWVLDEPLDVARVPGHVVGSVLHEVMEKAEAGKRLAEVLQGVLDMRRETGRARELLLAECLPLLSTLERSAFYERLSGAGGRREVGFSFLLEGCVFEGKIDRLLENEVVDFKSDSVSGEEVEAYAEHYRAQMDVYALAGARLNGSAPEKVTLYFLRPEREVSWEYGEDGLGEAERRVLDVVRGIRAGAPYPRSSEERCRCEYTSLCGIIARERSSRR